MLYAWTMLLTLLVGMQDLPKGKFPDGWTVRVDGHAGAAAPGMTAGDIVFVVMKPGWHITTGPAAIMYDPARTATGAYTLTSETFLFDPGTRREAYGVFIGGQHLDGDAQRYTYFVIRRSGEFLIRRRTGATTVDVKPWTPAAAIAKYDDRKPGQQTAKNVLQVTVTPDTATFLVNGTEVARVPARDIDTSGVVGLRVNHQLNIHVTSLDVTR